MLESERQAEITREVEGCREKKKWNARQRTCKVTQGLGETLHAADKKCVAPC